MTSNEILEIVNNLATIQRFFLVIFLVYYLLFGGARPIHPAPYPAAPLIISDVWKRTLGLAVVILIDKVGALTVGITVWLFRHGIGGKSGPIISSSVPGMATGSILMAAGTLMLLHVLSHGRFGNKLSGLAAAAGVAYILFEVIFS